MRRADRGRGDATFNLCRATAGAAPVKLNAEPLAGPTCFVDETPDLAQDNVYFVRALASGVGRAVE